MVSQLKEYGLKIELIDVADYRFGATSINKDSAKAKKFIKIISKADGLIIVSLEYNHG